MKSDQRPHSLRTRLLWFLLAAVLITAAAQTLVAYQSARAEADEIFDYQMQQMALSLQAGLPTDGVIVPGDAANDEENYDFVVQVWTLDGKRVFSSTSKADLPQRSRPGFSDVRAHGTVYRVFSLQARAQVIQVAQDVASRRAMAGALALRMVSPIAIAAPLLMLVVWWVVRASLAPVSRVRRQLGTRRADDLAEVSEAGLPSEILPLVQELNLLFGRVRQAFDAQNSFVADAAHELRSPLAALSLQVQGLRRAGESSAREVAVSRLMAGIDRATRLVEQLLTLARQQGGAASEGAPQPVRLAQIARLAVADAVPSARGRQIDLGLGEVDEGEIVGHAEPLRILIRNLLENAIKYTPPAGTVDVELRRQDDALILSVEDSGPGIPEQDRKRVLDRFYRVAGTETTGSGLGLAIVKAIADLHGASLVLGRSARLGGLAVQVRFKARD